MRHITQFIFDNWIALLFFIIVIFALPFILSRVLSNIQIIKSIKQTFQIIFTNWINVVAIFVAVYLAGFISAIVQDKATLNEAVFSTLIGVLGYGIMFWTGFLMLIILLDVLLFGFSKQPQYTNYKLITEWVLISSPFIYWLILYSQWVFLVAILAFLIGQLLRRRRISRILES